MPISWGKTKVYRNALERLLGRSIVELSEKDPGFLSEVARRRNISLALFDIEGFTDLTNYASPEAVVELLNAYFGGITRVVVENKGMVDAFFNEAVFCIFGAPIDEREHPALACKAALAGLRETVKLAAEWQVKGFARIKASIGIATGQCIVGNFGSEERTIYTAIGDLVNYTEQLRAATRLYGAPIIVSQETAQAARGRMLVRELDVMRGSGQKKHAPVFELLGPLDQASPTMREAVGVFEKGLELYRKREWEQAVSYFGDVSRLVGDDGPSRLFIRRCEHYLRHAPPPHWDGVHSPSMRMPESQ